MNGWILVQIIYMVEFSFLLLILTMRQIAFALEGTEKTIGLSHIIIKMFPVK